MVDNEGLRLEMVREGLELVFGLADSGERVPVGALLDFQLGARPQQADEGKPCYVVWYRAKSPQWLPKARSADSSKA